MEKKTTKQFAGVVFLGVFLGVFFKLLLTFLFTVISSEANR